MDNSLVKLTLSALALAAVFQACYSAPLMDTSGAARNELVEYPTYSDFKRASSTRRKDHSTLQGWGPGGMPYGALYYKNQQSSLSRTQQASSETNLREPSKKPQVNHKAKPPSYRRRPNRLPHTIIPHQFIVSYGWGQK